MSETPETPAAQDEPKPKATRAKAAPAPEPEVDEEAEAAQAQSDVREWLGGQIREELAEQIPAAVAAAVKDALKPGRPSAESRAGRPPKRGLFDLRGLFEYERPKS